MTAASRLDAFMQEFGDSRKMVLSTCLRDRVTSRMMSVVQKEGVFYFQTDKTLGKYEQLIRNPRAALCIDNIQIEGICREMGRPLNFPDFCSLYQKCYAGSFAAYGALENEVLFALKPLRIERWVYVESKPYIETMDLTTDEYRFLPYQGA